MGKKKGIISIRIRKTGIPQESTRVLVEIEDNGSGIKEQELTNIFERFYRTDTSRNSSKGGSGLGLAIVKKIIEDHGGIVYATGREGVGTCIYFTLEIAEKQKEQIKQAKQERQDRKNQAKLEVEAKPVGINEIKNKVQEGANNIKGAIFIKKEPEIEPIEIKRTKKNNLYGDYDANRPTLRDYQN